MVTGGRPGVITGAASAFAETVEQDALWSGFFRAHYDDSAIARRLFASAGPRRRHAVVNPLVEDASRWTTRERMRRYVPEALPLATAAVRGALAQAGVDAHDVGALVVVSCTGYASPGIDTYLARDLAMRSSVERLVIGHMGCFAALPGIAAASDHASARERPAVLVCVETSSLHVQPGTTDAEQMVAHALFSDAASAVVVEPGAAAGLRVVDHGVQVSHTDAELMTWSVTDLGFRMVLSPRIPEALRPHVQPTVRALLDRHGLAHDDVAAWAVHPGGPRILDVVGDELGLSDDDLCESRDVLTNHGNCSSATLLVVLDAIRSRRSLRRDDAVVAMAFGPGLTLHATLLRQS